MVEQRADLARPDFGRGPGGDGAAEAVLHPAGALCCRAFLALCFTYLVTVGWGVGDLNAVAAFTSTFLATFGVMQLSAVLMIGPALAAGAIAQERQRRTMEYLFTTPLSSLEIVVGKLGGRVLEVLGLVLAGLPVMALAMLLGGIAPQSLVALTAITLSTVVFVTEISLAISAWTAKARDAVIRAYLVFFGLWVLPLPLTAAPWMQQVAVLNPVLTFVESHFGWALGKSAEPWEVVLMLVRNQMLAGGMVLAVATLFMRRIHLREAARAVTRRSRLVRRRRREIGDNPMYWKEIYIEGGSSRLGLLGCGILVLVFIVICGLTSYMLFASLQSPTAPERGTVSTYALGVSTFLCCCGLLTVITRVSGSITGERDAIVGTC